MLAELMHALRRGWRALTSPNDDGGPPGARLAAATAGPASAWLGGAPAPGRRASASLSALSPLAQRLETHAQGHGNGSAAEGGPEAYADTDPYEAIIFTTGTEVAEKFRREATINERTLARARHNLKQRESEHKALLADDLENARRLFTAYRASGEAAQYAELKRVILNIKSNAGMVGMRLATDVSSLLFELFDEAFDFQSPKVLESVDLYLVTLEEIFTNMLIIYSDEEKRTLVRYFTELNERIR